MGVNYRIKKQTPPTYLTSLNASSQGTGSYTYADLCHGGASSDTYVLTDEYSTAVYYTPGWPPSPLKLASSGSRYTFEICDSMIQSPILSSLRKRRFQAFLIGRCSVYLCLSSRPCNSQHYKGPKRRPQK